MDGARVLPGTVAAERSFIAGDVIVKVQQDDVRAPGDIARRLAEARQLNRRHALVLVRRRDEQQWRSLPIVPPE